MAAVLAVGDGAALSHLAAATHWRVWRRDGAIETSVIAPRRIRSFDGVRAHTSRTLRPRDVSRRLDIPVTNVARTILDLGDVLTEWQLANVMHEAEFRNRFSRYSLDKLLARNRGRRAVTVVRRALEIRAGESLGTMSDLEDDFLSRALERGLDPLVNCPVRVLEGVVWPDFCWPEAMIVVEVDGSPHERARTRREDRGRAAQLREAGYTLFRCRPHEMDWCLDRVEALLVERGVHARRGVVI